MQLLVYVDGFTKILTYMLNHHTCISTACLKDSNLQYMNSNLQYMNSNLQYMNSNLQYMMYKFICFM